MRETLSLARQICARVSLSFHLRRARWSFFASSTSLNHNYVQCSWERENAEEKKTTSTTLLCNSGVRRLVVGWWTTHSKFACGISSCRLKRLPIPFFSFSDTQSISRNGQRNASPLLKRERESRVRLGEVIYIYQQRMLFASMLWKSALYFNIIGIMPITWRLHFVRIYKSDIYYRVLWVCCGSYYIMQHANWSRQNNSRDIYS